MRARVLAVAQTVPVAGDVAANLEAHVALVERAAREGAQVLVFPELSLTGYELARAAELAFTLDDPRLDGLAELARRHELSLIVGAPLRRAGRLHIAAVVLEASGTRRAYTKQHLGAFPEAAREDGRLPPAEATVFDPGALDPRLDIGGRSAAIAICADANRPTHAARAADTGATIYLASSFVIPSELARATANLADRAARHRMAVGFANFGGPSGGLAAAGRSSLWAEDGALVGQLGARGPGVLVAREDGASWQVSRLGLEAP
jgi:predicted amidohydrolase